MYKRQELQFGMIQFFQFGLLHLPKMQLITQLHPDVYKRQGMRFGLFSNHILRILLFKIGNGFLYRDVYKRQPLYGNG